MHASTIAALTVFALVSANASVGYADSVAEAARTSLDELRFDEARDTAVSGLEEGSRGPQELAELYMILGQISASLGEDEEAESYFQAALSLSDRAALPEGVSPKIGEPFTRAKESLTDSEPIALISEFDESGLLSVQISSDPAELVGGIEARYDEGGEEQRRRAKGIGTLRLELSPSASDIQVVLIDPHGNRLSDFVEVQGAQPSAAAVPTIAKTTTPGRSLMTRWELYAGVAVGSALAGAYFGVTSRSKSQELEDLDDGTEFRIAQGLQEDAERNALFANISFAAALGATAASVWFFLDARSEPGDTASASATWVPTIGPSQVGFAAQLKF